VVDELAPVVGVQADKGEREPGLIWVIASIIQRWAPFLMAMFSVRPVCTSVTVNE